MSLLKEVYRIQKLMNITESINISNSIFDKFDIDEFKNFPPPSDDSSETKKEVNKSVKHIFTKKPSFTLRQKEIIELIGNGYSSKEIAQQLELSLHTVHAHRRKLLYKFNCKNTSELLNMYHSEIS